MKRQRFILVLTLLMGLMGTRGYAHDIEVANSDGVTIYYNWTNNNTELQVTYRGDTYTSFSEYSGVVVIPATVTYNNSPYPVTSIGQSAFSDCSDLTSVTIPKSVTSIGWYVFDGCSSLTSISVESGNTVYDSRDNCNAIIKTAPNNLIQGCKNTIIPNSVTRINSYAFDHCSGLTSINIPNTVTSIGQRAFSYCPDLTSVIIPNSVTSIESGAFEGCSGLITVEIGNSVTSIGSNAFCDCISLTSVTIGNSLISIDNYAFRNCSSLISVTVNAETPPSLGVTYNPFEASNYQNATLYVPAGCKAAYQTAKIWKDFSAFLEIPVSIVTTQHPLWRE